MDAENIQRQLDEVEALRAMYPDDEGFLHLQPAEQQTLAAAMAALEAADNGTPLQDIYLSNLSGTITLPDVLLNGSPVSLRFQLPAAYPADAPAQTTLVCSAPRSIHEQLSKILADAAQEALGSESLLLLLDTLQVQVECVNSSSALHDQQQQPQQQEEDASSVSDCQAAKASRHVCNSCIQRVVIWFHHIKNSDKRKNLVGWARELNIAGFSKPGFPGVVIAEGSTADVQEYVARIRALQWQAMQVRGQQVVSCVDCEACKPTSSSSGDRTTCNKAVGTASANRGFKGRFEELEESGMAELGQLCKAAGMEELFLAALKLAK